MTRLVTEGWEHGDAAYALPNWSTATSGAGNSTWTVVADGKGWGYGSYVYQLYAQVPNVQSRETIAQYTLSASVSELYMRCSLRFLTTNSHNKTIFRIRDSSNNTLVRIDRNGATSTSHVLVLWRGGTSVLALGTFDNGWHTFEFRVKNTTGAFVMTVKIDGSVVYDVSDASPIGALNVNNIWFAASTNGISQSSTMRIDDFAINDTAGGVDDGWIGEGSVVALLPNGDGDSSQWTGSDGDTTSNYALVDDRPPNGDTDYVKAAETGLVDLYNVTSPTVAALDSVARVWAGAGVRKSDTEALTYKPGLKTGAVAVWSGSAITPVTTYTTYRVMDNPQLVNPDTGLAWTQSDLDGIQIGIQSA